MRAGRDLDRPFHSVGFDEAAAHARLARPSIGMPVRYHRAGRTDAGIVTHVHSDTLVNLRIFSDDDEVPAHATRVERRELNLDCWWEPV